jgi:hypothetical protein
MERLVPKTNQRCSKDFLSANGVVDSHQELFSVNHPVVRHQLHKLIRTPLCV